MTFARADSDRDDWYRGGTLDGNAGSLGHRSRLSDAGREYGARIYVMATGRTGTTIRAAIRIESRVVRRWNNSN